MNPRRIIALIVLFALTMFGWPLLMAEERVVLYENNFDSIGAGVVFGSPDNGGLKGDGLGKLISAPGSNAGWPRAASWFGTQISGLSDWMMTMEVTFVSDTGGKAGFTIDFRGVRPNEETGGRHTFSVERGEDNVGKVVIIADDNGFAVKADSTDPSKGGLSQSISLEKDSVHILKVIKVGYQIELFLDDVKVVKTALRLGTMRSGDDSFLWGSHTPVKIDDFRIVYATTADLSGENVEVPVATRPELPSNVYYAESFNQYWKQGTEFSDHAVSDGLGRIVTDGLGWNEVLLTNGGDSVAMSADFLDLSTANPNVWSKHIVGFSLSLSGNTYFISAFSDHENQQLVIAVSTESGGIHTTLTTNTDTMNGGLIPSIPLSPEVFHLAVMMEIVDDTVTIQAYVDLELVLDYDTMDQYTVDPQTTLPNSAFTLFTGDGLFAIDNVLCMQKSRYTNAVRPYTLDPQWIPNANSYETFDTEELIGANLANWAAVEGGGFIYDAYGKTAIAANASSYTSSYRGPDAMTSFVYSVQMRDLGTYNDGTRHVGGLSFRTTSSFGRYDLQIVTDAGASGTQIQIYQASPSTKLMDYKDASLGGGIHPDLRILPGTPFTITLYFQEGFVVVFINDIKVLEGDLPGVGTGGFGLRSHASQIEYDNLYVSDLPTHFVDGTEVPELVIPVVPIIEVYLTTTSNTIDTNGQAILTANVSPYNATTNAYSWYVNDMLVEGATDKRFTFQTTTPGTYTIRGTIDGMSGTKTITVNQAIVEQPNPRDWTWVYVGIGSGTSLVGGIVIFLLSRKRPKLLG